MMDYMHATREGTCAQQSATAFIILRLKEYVCVFVYIAYTNFASIYFVHTHTHTHVNIRLHDAVLRRRHMEQPH